MNYTAFWHKLSEIYDEGEARAVARYVLEERFGMRPSEMYCGAELSDVEQKELDAVITRLMNHEPVQYVLGAGYFCGRRFSVAPGVLIPRPETEELVSLIGRRQGGIDILDIGTGSGCIAVSLALDNPDARVTAWDISPDALKIAARNASALNARVTFCRRDALRPPCDNARWDVIVSNPPYICDNERAAMDANVLCHEPHLALFVPDDDPLLFYRSITRYARSALKSGGELFFEINPLYADAMTQMVHEEGFEHAGIIIDQYGKKRMMKITKNVTLND